MGVILYNIVLPAMGFQHIEVFPLKGLVGSGCDSCFIAWLASLGLKQLEILRHNHPFMTRVLTLQILKYSFLPCVFNVC